MIFVQTDILNPYQREIVSQDNYDRLIDFLQDKYPTGFEKPTDISINGIEIKIDDYDIDLNENDIVVLLDRTALPVGLIGGWFITALANLAISITISYIANQLFAPDAPDELVASSSVYNINNAQNTSRFGSPIPVIYGTVKMFPSMIVQPYYRFDDDIEYLYHVLCVGQGACTTDDVYIGTDLITTTEDMEWTLLYQDDFFNIPYNAYGYHVTKTLSVPDTLDLESADNVETEKYTISADASKVEFDYMLPNGLFYVKGDGEYVDTHITFECKVYTYDGADYTLVKTKEVYHNAVTRDAIQRTVTINISAYDEEVYVSFERTYAYDHSRDTHNCYIKRVKEIYPNEDFTNLYGDITLLAVKIKATDTVGSAGQVKVNGYFERTDVGNTMHEVLTDIYTNTTYGAGLSSDDLDFPVTTETVDCAYEKSMTVFDAMRKPALAQMYSTYLAGMDVILKKDEANTVTSAMYNELNILKDSLKVQYLFKEEYPVYDGYKVTYIDGEKWIPETATYPDTSTRPQVVDLFGVVSPRSYPPSGEDLTVIDSVTTTDMDGDGEIAIRGSVAYMTSSLDDTLISVDISDPSNLTVLDTFTSASITSAMGLAIDGNVAYVVSLKTASVITSIDISDPSNMTELDTFSDATMVYSDGIAIYNNVAYLANGGTKDIVAIDIGNPSSMSLEGTFESANISGGKDIVIDETNEIAYMSGYGADSVIAVDISDPTLMVELDTITSGTYLNGASGVAISGDHLFALSRINDYITAIDISDPSNMSITSAFTSVNTTDPRRLIIAYDVAYIARYNFTTSVTSIDVSDPSSMVELDNLVSAGGRASDVALSGDNIYVKFESSSDIYSVDAADPSPTFTIPDEMAKYLYKQDDSRRKIVSFSTDIQGLVPQFLDKIMVSHNALQWGEAGEVVSVSGSDIVLSIPLEDTAAGKTIVFRDVDGSVSDALSITITDSTHVTVTSIPAWVAAHTFYTVQESGTAKEFVVIGVKPNGENVQIDCVNYDADIFT